MRIRVLLLSFLMLAALWLPRTARAEGGVLDSPSISLPAGVQFDALKVLADKRHRFIRGSHINWSTALYYAGEAKDLNAFISALLDIPGTTVSVRFSKEAGVAIVPAFNKANEAIGDEPCQWRVSHTAGRKTYRHFDVLVYLGDGKIDVEQLRMPVMKSLQSSIAVLLDGPDGPHVQTLLDLQDKEKLQGRWTVVSTEEDGEKRKTRAGVAIEGDRLTTAFFLGATPAGSEFTFALNGSTLPKRISLTGPLPDEKVLGGGKVKPLTQEGIYSLEGDALKVCFAPPGKERPTEFSTKPGLGRTLLELRRDPPEKTRKPGQERGKDSPASPKKEGGAAADEAVPEDTDNTISQRLPGKWQIDADLTTRLTGEQVPNEIRQGIVEFEKDPSAVDRLPPESRDKLKKKGIYAAGTVNIVGGPVNVKDRPQVFVVTSYAGVPYLGIFAPSDGKYPRVPTWERVMIAEAREREDDLLFLTHPGALRAGPFSQAFRRVAADQHAPDAMPVPEAKKAPAKDRGGPREEKPQRVEPENGAALQQGPIRAQPPKAASR